MQVFGIPLEWCSELLEEVIPETPPTSQQLVVAQPPIDHHNRGILHAPNLPPLSTVGVSIQHSVPAEKQAVASVDQQPNSSQQVVMDLVSG